ncbi:MAG: hypothetical protein ISR65_09865 [Bacteriovoracaceae bacterium]|nr:hypothetical protein [Bacteriovoracaceae bacterium]
MKASQMRFDQSDFQQFRDWINLDLESITWQGRYCKEFEEFWDTFFTGNITLVQLMDRFQYAMKGVRIGPLISWFSWLKEKLLVFVFLNKNISIYALAKASKVSISWLSGVLRIYFLEKFPYLDEYFSAQFQIGNVASQNLSVTFEQISSKLEIKENLNGRHEDEVMSSLEVTLYSEWELFLKNMKKDFRFSNITHRQIVRGGTVFKKQLKVLKEVILLTAAGFLLIYSVKVGNEWYQKNLANKIRIYEPQFTWLDSTLKFKETTKSKEASDFHAKLPNLDSLKDKGVLFEEIDEAQQWRSESEVVLTSWDSLPKDFDVSGLEQSEYEELRKGGYRDTRLGNKKAYRVMIKSIDALDTRSKLTRLVQDYEAAQVDKVKPGKLVPGGVYYNLYVPVENLKEFIAQVMEVDEAILYESRTRRRNPPGKTRVFIWIKTI